MKKKGATKSSGGTQETPNEADLGTLPFVENASCSGSLNNSENSNPQSDFILAKLEEEQLKEELELSNKQAMMKAAHKVRLARLKLELADGATAIDVPGLEKCASVDKYLDKEKEKLGPKSINIQATGLAPCMPKLELQYFDGDPCQYWKFIRQFETYIEYTTCDDAQRMLYLLHYCKGQAREAIDGCTMLPAGCAYKRAREILTDLYGQPHAVARSMIDDLLSSVARCKGDGRSLTQLAIQMQNCETMLSQMNCESDMDSLSTLEAIVRRLPSSTQNGWARVVDSLYKEHRNPKFRDLQSFVSDEARIARSRFGQLAFNSGTRYNEKPMRDTRQVHSTAVMKEQPDGYLACYICRGEHDVERCAKFISLSVQKRWQLVREHRACFLCLRKGHVFSKCRVRIACSVPTCTTKHNPLLHLDHKYPSTDELQTCNSIGMKGKVRLGVFPVTLYGPLGTVNTYAMLDNGSDISLVQRSILHELGIPFKPESLRIRTLNAVSNLESGTTRLTVAPLGSKEPTVVIDRAFCVDSLPQNNCRSFAEDVVCWDHLKDLEFQDLKDTRVGLLIGADTPEAHWVKEQRLGRRNEPFASLTALGWVVLGPLSSIQSTDKGVFGVERVTEGIEEQLKRIYDSEFGDSGGSKQGMSIDETEALRLVENSCVLVNGHFEVGLPWKRNSRELCDNYVQANSRLMSLRSRFRRNPELFRKYADVMARNLSKGYATLVPDYQLCREFRPRWYLPHHAVLNPKKPEKVRVVHDCAARYKALSLNDCLYQGPDTLRSLVGVLMRFRKEIIAVSADIEEMFMQVSVPINDRGALRFLWWPRNDLSLNPVEYQMAVHPFGAVSSPFVANFALKRSLTLCDGTESPLVTEAILNNFYVDDLLISIENRDDTSEIVCQIRRALSKGGFKLRKWLSNSIDALKGVPTEELAQTDTNVKLTPASTHKTLGLEWSPADDTFHFVVHTDDELLTRRRLLSVVSSVFDPLGLIAPLLLPAKLLLQKLCRDKLDWDAELGSTDKRVWAQWVCNTRKLSSLRIPRCLKRVGNHTGEPQWHVFCDASESGYGAVVYIRFVPENSLPYCSLVVSKSRVAPLKSVTVPRLELAAAKLGASLLCTVKEELGWSDQKVYFWTDSTIVLYYINNTSTRFSTFVSNRVAAIRESSNTNQWYHVKSEENPADLVSRGAESLEQLFQWLKGPRFLELPEMVWSSRNITLEPPLGVELKRDVVRVNATKADDEFHNVLDYYSSWTKLIRSIAWMCRFKRYIVNKGQKQSPELSSEELKQAERNVLQLVQTRAFPQVATTLTSGSGRNRLKGTQLYKLNPVLIDGLICMDGRLRYATSPQVVNNPIILPKQHSVTDLLIRYYHKREGHSGVPHVLAVLRQKYWVIQGATTVKRVIGRCTVCRRYSAQRCQQLMAPLPVARVDPGWFPFQHVGVDYFGPFFVKRGRGTEKRYGCVFSCLQTRAVHLEIAHTLTTDAFILVLMRFIGRRGESEIIYSDNGTNFVGAQRELKEYISRFDHHKIASHLSQQGIQWHFQPASASHRGGVWERIIRSVRRILYSLGMEQTVTDEVLSTLLIEAERILNNRPLVPVSADPGETAALTPNHLLLMRGNSGILPSMTENYTRGWKQALYLAGVFWRRWLREYLPTLQTRQKWNEKRRNLKVGDLVLLSKDDARRGKWPLGVVIESHESKDGLVRQVSVRSAGSVIKRDIRSVCLLEGDDVMYNKEKRVMSRSASEVDSEPGGGL